MWYIGQSLIALDHRACRLQWGASSDDDLAGYNVYMSLTNESGSYEKVNTELLTEPEFVYGCNLRNDQKYYFYVTAVDFAGNESEASNIIEFKLSDYRDDEVIVVNMPKKVTISAGGEYRDQPITSSFLTKFELGGSS
jgi:hypothetical protein